MFSFMPYPLATARLNQTPEVGGGTATETDGCPEGTAPGVLGTLVQRYSTM